MQFSRTARLTGVGYRTVPSLYNRSNLFSSGLSTGPLLARQGASNTPWVEAKDPPCSSCRDSVLIDPLLGETIDYLSVKLIQPSLKRFASEMKCRSPAQICSSQRPRSNDPGILVLAQFEMERFLTRSWMLLTSEFHAERIGYRRPTPKLRLRSESRPHRRTGPASKGLQVYSDSDRPHERHRWDRR